MDFRDWQIGYIESKLFLSTFAEARRIELTSDLEETSTFQHGWPEHFLSRERPSQKDDTCRSRI